MSVTETIAQTPLEQPPARRIRARGKPDRRSSLRNRSHRERLFFRTACPRRAVPHRYFDRYVPNAFVADVANVLLEDGVWIIEMH
jgi:hypothetical protein